MKVPRDGAGGRAYKVVVAGGRDPDLPLTPHSVPEIVRSALKERIPLIIDLFSKTLSKADWRRIVTAAIHIIHYENEGGALHVFLEEAAEFVPQRINDGETYAEVEKLVRMGGNASVGITLINQRSQEVNKAVLDNCGTALVLGCQVGKHAIEAVGKWIERLDENTAVEVTSSLPKLKPGEAWVWTRKNEDHPTREQMPMCRSFHPDRRTPEIVIQSAKATDTAEFVARMAKSIPHVIEEAKANDPGELKRQIAELKRQLDSRPAEKEIVREPVFDADCRDLLEKTRRVCDEVLEATYKRADSLVNIHRWLIDAEKRLSRNHTFAIGQGQFPGAGKGSNPPRRPVAGPSSATLGDGSKFNKAQQRVLDALAWFESVGTTHPSHLQVGAVAMMDSTGGYFSNTVGPLSTAGLIDRGAGVLSLTEEGRKHANVPSRISTMAEYHDTLRERVRRSRNAVGKTVEILDALIRLNGGAATTEHLGAAVGIDHTGGYFSNTIGPLSTLGLIKRSQGIVTPTEILFPEALR